MKYAPIFALVLAGAACQKGNAPVDSQSESGAEAGPVAATVNLPSTSKWAGTKIGWQTAEIGLAKAKAENRPVMLVVKAEWCGQCKKYSKLFHEDAVEKASRDFVMVLLDGDTDPAAQNYAPDGTYVPRTFFLTPDGEIETSLKGPNPRYRYYLNGSKPETLTTFMARARETLGG